nr:hypothetical protein [Dinophyceae sp. MRD-151]
MLILTLKKSLTTIRLYEKCGMSNKNLNSIFFIELSISVAVNGSYIESKNGILPEIILKVKRVYL